MESRSDRVVLLDAEYTAVTHVEKFFAVALPVKHYNPTDRVSIELGTDNLPGPSWRCEAVQHPHFRSQ
jgi:hypothetical protein